MKIDHDRTGGAGARGHVDQRRPREPVVLHGEREVGGGRGGRRRQHQQRPDQARGLTQVSDQAKQALDD
jgi:hypothetical protein